MRNKLKILLVALLALSLTFILFACDDNGNGNGGNGGGIDVDVEVDFDLGEPTGTLTRAQIEALMQDWEDFTSDITPDFAGIAALGVVSKTIETEGDFGTITQSFVSNGVSAFFSSETIFTYGDVTFTQGRRVYFYNNTVYLKNIWDGGYSREIVTDADDIEEEFWQAMSTFLADEDSGLDDLEQATNMVGRTYQNGYLIAYTISVELPDDLGTMETTAVVVLDSEGRIVGMQAVVTGDWEMNMLTNIVWGGTPTVPTPDVSLW